MPTYEYRCPECGLVEKLYAMGAAPSVEMCSHCSNPAKRVFSVSLLGRTSRGLGSAFEQAEKSRDDPTVARRGQSDSRQATASPTNPVLERLVGKEAARELKPAPQFAKLA